jgi:aspartyl-tRNA synthetase
MLGLRSKTDFKILICPPTFRCLNIPRKKSALWRCIHPFTMPLCGGYGYILTAIRPGAGRSPYDVVLNGIELGSGKHPQPPQGPSSRGVRSPGLLAEEIQNRFGFMIMTSSTVRRPTVASPSARTGW